MRIISLILLRFIVPFSHYWIVVIRLDDTTTFDPMENPSQVFPDASAFGNYSSHLVLPNSPYIAAEISADNYQGNSVFVIGDEAGTMSINDFPLLYENGPLLEGAEYTAFVRAFTNTVPVSRGRGGDVEFTCQVQM